MPRLVSAQILPEANLAGEIQVELTWERPLVKRLDWKSLHAALRANDMPVERYIEIRAYASIELADRAIANLEQQRRVA